MSGTVLWVRTTKMNWIFSDPRMVPLRVEVPIFWSSTVIGKPTAPSSPHCQILPLLQALWAGTEATLLAWLLLLYSPGEGGVLPMASVRMQ